MLLFYILFQILFSIGILYVFQLWEWGGWVDGLFDGWGWGGTGRVELTQKHFKYI